MKYTLFAGCSFTHGNGFKLESDEPCLWVNQLYNKFFSHTQKLNVSKGGRSNAGIFQDTVKALLKYPVEYAIVEWTSMPRYEMDLGFETFSTRQWFMPNGILPGHTLNDVSYSSAYLTAVCKRFTTLAHDYYEISNLVEYVNILVNLTQLTKTKIFFINGICPWDKDFFIKKENVLPSEYTWYTQKILNTKNRLDKNIYQLYNIMHDNFTNLGGIHESVWLNLYSSMFLNRIDVNSDTTHPGIDSNNLYFDLFSESLNKQLL